ncbi:MAG: hypothetical protein QF733_04380 [Phycisphaerales bacterium]|jgi:hypothetical protein|nr:hypothetical protein [Phycisphaerales bacterium]
MGEDPIPLEPLGVPDPPPLPGRVRIDGTFDDAVDALAADLLTCALDAVEARQQFSLAISGDRVLEPLWLRCMLDPDLRAFPWSRTHVRVLGEVDRLWLNEALVTPAGIPPAQVHVGPASVGPASAGSGADVDCVVASGATAAAVMGGGTAPQQATRLLMLTEAASLDATLRHVEANPAPWAQVASRLCWYL